MGAVPDEPPRDLLPGGNAVLAAKLRAPHRPGLVDRPRLVRHLASGSGHALTLLSAPAGWGKTSLLGDWVRGTDETVAWLSLDEHDDDPNRFCSYLVAALRTVVPGIGERALRALGSGSHGLTEAVLPSLINDLEAAGERLVLVLDDYQVIRGPDVHRAVEHVLRWAPPHLRLVIAGRSDPPLSIGRRRAAGELVEVRRPDLAFTDLEAGRLLTRGLGLDLSESDLTSLARRTEGWAAGLYLAGLSLRHRDDPTAFVQAFAGTDRYVLDYLGSEVLAAQPPATRRFMLETSILPRMSAELCVAVTGRPDSAAMLASVAATNGFLIAVDEQQEWYRYHRLLGELLRHELTLAEPDRPPELHRRAARWFEATGAVPEAVEHALAGSDVELAATLVGHHWTSYFNAGLLRTVEQWLEALPEGEVRADARLCLARAWTLLDRGRLEAVDTWITGCEQSATEPGVVRDAAVVRAVHRLKIGDVGTGHDAARRVLEIGGREPGFAATVAHCVLGMALFWRGEPAAATRALREAMRLARATRNQLAEAYALGYLALAHLQEGALPDGRRVADVAVERAREPAVAEHFVAALPHLALAAVLAAAGETGPARPAVARALDLVRRGGGRLEVGLVLATQAQVQIAAGDDGDDALAAARLIVRGCPDPGWLPERLAALGRSRRRPSHGPAPHGPLGEPGDPTLSDREAVLLPLLAGTLSLREIGAVLHVSLNTVKTQSRTLYRKLGVSSRGEAVLRARQRGLLEESALSGEPG